MGNKVVDRPKCGFKCLECTEPDCTYSGDYVSEMEKRAAALQDRRARWYRVPWAELQKREKQNTLKKKKREAKKMKSTEEKTIDLSIAEAEKLASMGYILVINDGNILEVIHEVSNG